MRKRGKVNSNEKYTERGERGDKDNDRDRARGKIDSLHIQKKKTVKCMRVR